MKRILLAISLGLAAGVAQADNVAEPAGSQPVCPDKATQKAKAAPPASDPDAAAPTVPSPKARGGGTNSAKLVSPRWHSLLPGMFR